MTETEAGPPPATKLGRPYTPLPEPLTQLLDASYRERAPKPVSLRGGDRDAVAQVVRMARIYARRNGKALHAQVGEGRLWLHMADKRPYTRRTA